jgi:TRAP-type C4-dicarboxylate transport system substrate-binding protein
MNEDKWAKLSKEDQAIITRHAGEAAARSNGQSWDRADKVGREALQKAGGAIVTASPAMAAEARKRSAPIIDEWLKQASAKGINAKAVLDEFHAELKKVAAGK